MLKFSGFLGAYTTVSIGLSLAHDPGFLQGCGGLVSLLGWTLTMVRVTGADRSSQRLARVGSLFQLVTVLMAISLMAGVTMVASQELEEDGVYVVLYVFGGAAFWAAMVVLITQSISYFNLYGKRLLWVVLNLQMLILMCTNWELVLASIATIINVAVLLQVIKVI